MNDNQETTNMQGAVCPVPLPHNEQIVLGHGSGGKLTHDLVTKIFKQAFNNPILAANNDAGAITQSGVNLSISTDAHVVKPLFFPGGDIGRLAVCGTVNDVSMLGAKPLYLTASFILEEGLPIETINKVVTSMQTAAEEAGVQIIAGDTKVVEKGKADGLYISTTGVGITDPNYVINGSNAQPRDMVIVSGPIGDHGIAVLSARGELGFETDIQSDVAPLNSLIQCILNTSNNIHVLRDPTRGGLATTLNEIAQQSHMGIILDELAIPVRPEVQSACEMLGFDPLYIANEGKLVVIVSPQDAETVMSAMKSHPYGHEAQIIGEVATEPPGRVLIKTIIGSHRVVDVLMGELLPRIC